MKWIYVLCVLIKGIWWQSRKNTLCRRPYYRIPSAVGGRTVVVHLRGVHIVVLRTDLDLLDTNPVWPDELFPSGDVIGPWLGDSITTVFSGDFTALLEIDPVLQDELEALPIEAEDLSVVFRDLRIRRGVDPSPIHLVHAHRRVVASDDNFLSGQPVCAVVGHGPLPLNLSFPVN